MTTPMQSFKRPPVPRRTFVRWAQFLFLTLGLVALGYSGYMLAEAQLFQSYQEWRLDQLQQGKPASVPRYVKLWIPFLSTEEPRVTSPRAERSPRSNATTLEAGDQTFSLSNSPAEEASLMPRPARRTSRLATAPGTLIGRIEIPRLHLRAIVMEGVDSHTLRLAAGHLPGTALPGDPGNVDIAAHRDTFFRGLRNIRYDDLISVSTVSGKLFRYRVGAISVVAPNNVGILEASSGPGVNLITCYPFNYVGSAPKRFVVHADEISESTSLMNGQASVLNVSQLEGEAGAGSRGGEPAHTLDSPRAAVAAKHRKMVRRVRPRPALALSNGAPGDLTVARAARPEPVPSASSSSEMRKAEASPEVAPPADTNSDPHDPPLPNDNGHRSRHPKVKAFFSKIFRHPKF